MPGINAMLTRVLNLYGVGVEDYSTQAHSIPGMSPLYGRSWNPVGIVMHNTDGLIEMKNMVPSWARKKLPPPSHLGIHQNGTVAYFVRLDFADRATEHTNKHISIEFQAVHNGDLTDAQLYSAGLVYAFLHNIYGIPFTVASTREQAGLAHHALFVDANNPEGHFTCPGPAIIGRKQDVIDRAKAYAVQMDMGSTPIGFWWARIPGYVWLYQFKVDQTVTWKDPYNGENGTGTWKQVSSEVRISWKGSKTIEKWTKIEGANAEGTVKYEGETEQNLTAMRKPS